METINQTSNWPEEREVLFRHFVRYARRVTNGVDKHTETEGQALIDKLVTLSAISPEESAQLQMALQARMEHARQLLDADIQKAIDTAIKKLGEATDREINRIASKISALETRLTTH